MLTKTIPPILLYGIHYISWGDFSAQLCNNYKEIKVYCETMWTCWPLDIHYCIWKRKLACIASACGGLSRESVLWDCCVAYIPFTGKWKPLAQVLSSFLHSKKRSCILRFTVGKAVNDTLQHECYNGESSPGRSIFSTHVVQISDRDISCLSPMTLLLQY